MQTLDTLKASNKPSFETSLSQGFYIITFDKESDITFEGITADMLYGFYISKGQITQNPYQVTKGLDPSNPKGSVEKTQEDIIGTQAFSKYAQSIPSPIPLEYATRKLGVDVLQDYLLELEDLIKNSPEYQSKINKTLDRINVILDS